MTTERSTSSHDHDDSGEVQNGYHNGTQAIEHENGHTSNGFVSSANEPKGPPQACLFVASLSPETSEEALREFFIAQCNGEEPLKLKILKDKSSRPYAFVQYKDVTTAIQALQNTNGQMLDGRRLRVEKAKVNRTLFIAKMDRTFTSAQLREIVEAFGTVENVTIIKNHQTNKSKGCGFVKFVFREDAMEAFLGLKNTQKKWIIEWATSTNDPDSLGIDRTNVFVGGLNPSLITRELIEERFGAYGEVQSVTLINKEAESAETNQENSLPRSAFAFIRYADSSSSALAIENENGAEWLDRRIRVQYCESIEMKNKRRATKYMAQMVPPYDNQYFRGLQSPPMGPLVMGGIPAPIYDLQGRLQRNPYLRKDGYPPYMGYPMMNPGMVPHYGTQPWLYTQQMQVQHLPPEEDDSSQSPPPMQEMNHYAAPEMVPVQTVDDSVLVDSLAAMNFAQRASRW